MSRFPRGLDFVAKIHRSVDTGEKTHPLYFSIEEFDESVGQTEGRNHAVSKMLKVTPNDDYTLLVEFEHGNKIIFNMGPLIKTIPYYSLNDLERFKDITLEEKAIRWPDPVTGQKSMMPIRLTVDNMLFAIRD